MKVTDIIPLDRVDTKKVADFVRGLLDRGIKGTGPLSGSEELARQYRDDPSYRSADERVDALIRWEATKNFGTGFVTGLGGLITLPVSIPASLYASWVVQARLVGAVASLYGHSLENDRVRTFVLLAVLGDAGKEALKDGGISAANRVTLKAVSKISEKTLADINKKIGLHLLKTAGNNGLINLSKAVPVVGGLVGGIVDSITCVMTGRMAKRLFGPAGTAVAAAEKRERFDVRFSGEKLSRIVSGNVPALKSLSLPEDGVIELRFRGIPVKFRYRLTCFAGGTVSFVSEGSAPLRAVTARIAEARAKRLGGNAAGAVTVLGNVLRVDLDGLITRLAGLKGLAVEGVDIRDGELLVSLR